MNHGNPVKHSGRTLLYVGAHPDDESFGIGGTLALYAAAGVRVYYACATRGEAGTADEASMRSFNSMGDMRWAELECAARVLRLAGVIHLGYRDSGMAGAPDNHHPDCLFMADPVEISGSIVKIIRELKPEVVITHDPLGGYRHPDHISINRAVRDAFLSAGDPSQYAGYGPDFKPQKLYFNVFPKRWLKLAVKLLPLAGQNPRRFGRNHDIDLISMLEIEFPVHARIRLDRASIETRDKAVSCYASQNKGRLRSNRLMRFIDKLSTQQECYMRAFPAPDGKPDEKDLFAGVV